MFEVPHDLKKRFHTTNQVSHRNIQNCDDKIKLNLGKIALPVNVQHPIACCDCNSVQDPGLAPWIGIKSSSTALISRQFPVKTR
uniref:Uncharacterized protein n=1 Tax=Romanomermis culicivorax TaxID=13658 RepID=A0A915HP05_ROMCU